MRVGDLVRIKEIPGTRLASKRQPVWGIVASVGAIVDDEQHRAVQVEMLTEVVFENPHHSRTRVWLNARCLEQPADRQIPEWVCVEIAKRKLLKGTD
jgi:hypothetical protein